MSKKILSLFFLIIIGISNAYAESGISLGATRLIYTSGLKQASVSVTNGSDKAFLIQSWVAASTNSNTKEDSLFLTTPPLFRLEADSTNTVRIVFVGKGLPSDRESVYWLNVKAIPSVTKSSDNKLIIAIKSQIKLFYRPEGLKGDPSEAYKQISFSAKNGQLVITNPTAYNISFGSIEVNGSTVKDLIMAKPFSEQTIKRKVSIGQTITWNAINDYGAILPDLSAKITK